MSAPIPITIDHQNRYEKEKCEWTQSNGSVNFSLKMGFKYMINTENSEGR